MDFVSCHPSGNLESDVAVTFFFKHLCFPALISHMVSYDEVNVNWKNNRRKQNGGLGRNKNESVHRIEGLQYERKHTAKANN